MSGLELALALPGVVEICLKLGASILETCQNIKHARSHLKDEFDRLEAFWINLLLQLPTLKRLAPLLPEEHQQVQQNLLERLLSKLVLVEKKLASLTTKASDAGSVVMKVKRFKYAMIKSSFGDTISDLCAWKELFDTLWLHMMTIRNVEIDNHLPNTTEVASGNQSRQPSTIATAKIIRHYLGSEVGGSRTRSFLPPTGLVAESIRPIPLSPVSIAQRAGGSQTVILDPITCAEFPYNRGTLKDVETFANRLTQVDPFKSGLLECKGVVKDEIESPAGIRPSTVSICRPSFVFRLPQSHQNVQSMRQYLLHEQNREKESLSSRFALAQQLARAVSYVHIYGFVHKNIRPETVLLLENGTLPSDVITESYGRPQRTAVLVGFDVLRSAEGKTRRIGDNDWQKNMYRHPKRQGVSLSVDYEMRHDIYSLGVCLLEIGLLETFVDYDLHTDSSDKGIKLGIGLGLHPEEDSQNILEDPNLFKNHLITLAKGRLRHKMGTRYSKIVEICLSCLDQGNSELGDGEEFQDEDGTVIGTRYIDKVLVSLSDIQV